MGSTKDIAEWNRHKMETLTYNEKDNIRYNIKIGKTYGNLTILQYIGKTKYGHPEVLCKCKLCESEKIMSLYKVTSGYCKSCGCEQMRKTSEANSTHRLTKSKIYNTYNKMKDRCYKEYDNRYHAYGALGIKVCSEWLGKDGFINFYNWAIENGYDESLSIDRKDPWGDYCPENCRWITISDQAKNKKRTIWLQYRGYEFPLTIWAEIVGIGYTTLFFRYNKGWSAEDILRTPLLGERDNGFLCWEVDPKYMKYHKPNFTGNN